MKLSRSFDWSAHLCRPVGLFLVLTSPPTMMVFPLFAIVYALQKLSNFIYLPEIVLYCLVLKLKPIFTTVNCFVVELKKNPLLRWNELRGFSAESIFRCLFKSLSPELHSVRSNCLLLVSWSFCTCRWNILRYRVCLPYPF